MFAWVNRGDRKLRSVRSVDWLFQGRFTGSQPARADSAKSPYAHQPLPQNGTPQPILEIGFFRKNVLRKREATTLQQHFESVQTQEIKRLHH
jgi:hypothetical protein